MTPPKVTDPAVLRTPAALLAPVLAVMISGCAPAPIGPVTIQTQSPRTICLAARVGGVLVADPAYGLAFKKDGGTRGVVWPNGYSARREQDGVVVLIDPSGRIVAREGDTILSAGNGNDSDVSFPCGDLQVNPSSTDSAEASAAPPCGVYSTYDWAKPNGKTPDEAVDAFKAAILAQEPTDAKESMVRAALLSAIELATTADKTGGLVTYEARSGETLVGTISVIGYPDGYLVSSSWVPVPEAFCSTGVGG